MKHLFSVFSNLLIVACFAFAFTACGDDEPDSPDKDETIRKEIIGNWHAEYSETVAGIPRGSESNIVFKNNGELSCEEYIHTIHEGNNGILIQNIDYKYEIKDNILTLVNKKNSEQSKYTVVMSNNDLILVYVSGHKIWGYINVSDGAILSPDNLTYRRK